jgi:hypothetical protein
VVRFDTGIHLGRRGLAGWNWFHSNLFLSRHHRVEGGLWGWNGILIADWQGGGHHRGWLPDHAAIRFLLGSGTVTSVPSFVGFDDLPSRRLSGSALQTLAILPTCGGRRRAKGEKASPLAIPGLWRMPTAGKAPSCGLPSTGREPHAIPGVTLPLPVILTAHRLRTSLHSARQTASGLGE